MVKYFTLIFFSLCVPFTLFCQSERQESAIGCSAGVGYMPFSGTIDDYFRPTLGGSISLDFYNNRMAYFLSFNGSKVRLRQAIFTDNGDIWNKDSENSIFSYGLSVGYSVYNRGRFRITPFTGLMLSQSRPSSSDVKEYSYLKAFDVGPVFSPAFGLNMTFHFRNTDSDDSEMFPGSDFRISMNTRITYVPSAVRNKKLPYNGGAWYLTIGVSMEIFAKY